VGARRLARDRLLAADGKDEAGISGRGYVFGRHGPARRPTAIHLLRPADDLLKGVGPNGWRRRKSRTVCYSIRPCRRSRSSASGEHGLVKPHAFRVARERREGLAEELQAFVRGRSNRTSIRAR